MPRRRKIEPFYIVVTDSEARRFNVLGPMDDDTSINRRVVKLQDQGARVNCHTAGGGQSREEVVNSYARFSGFTYTDKGIAD